jgi:prepilin-type N-terminal cleavage/methylation domain-containing protein
MTKIRLFLLVSKTKFSQSGYTLIESLVALVVVGILITSVAPMLALTTASRVQARRVDQATQALRAYIDGVRGGALPLPQKFVAAPASFIGPNYGFTPGTFPSGYTIPGNINSEPGTLIDTNGNGFNTSDPQDLVIQTIRPAAICTPACTANSAQELRDASNQGFLMVVRVYRADAFEGIDTPDQTVQSGVFIGTLGSRENPLAATVAEVYATGSLNEIRNRTFTGP